MPKLESIWLIYEGPVPIQGQLSEEGFAKLGQGKTLKSLRLNNLIVSDEAARKLHELSALKKLHIGYCQISDEAIQELGAALPIAKSLQYNGD